jgi:hypothetical protein
VFFESERLLASFGIPDLQRLVHAAADDPLPVGVSFLLPTGADLKRDGKRPDIIIEPVYGDLWSVQAKALRANGTVSGGG